VRWSGKVRDGASNFVGGNTAIALGRLLAIATAANNTTKALGSVATVPADTLATLG